MKRRIEIWVDVDISEFQFDYLRQYLENKCWDAVRNLTDDGFVQANEVERPSDETSNATQND